MHLLIETDIVLAVTHNAPTTEWSLPLACKSAGNLSRHIKRQRPKEARAG